MAALATMTMGERNEERPKVYSIFQKNSSKPANSNITDASPIEAPSSSESGTSTINENLQSGYSRIVSSIDKQTIQPIPSNLASGSVARRTSSTTRKKGKGVSSLDEVYLPKSGAQGEHKQSELLEVDPNNGRRKRQKKTSIGKDKLTEGGEDDFLLHTKSLQKQKRGKASKKQIDPLSTQLGLGNININSIMASPTSPIEDSHVSKNISQIVDTPPLQLESTCAHDPTDEPSIPSEIDQVKPVISAEEISPIKDSATNSKPKKVLKWNPKTGTIGSPPKKPIPLQASSGKDQRVKSSKLKIVVIRYGECHHLPLEVGPKIDQILSQPKSIPPVSELVVLEPHKTTKPTPDKKSKPVHPLFMGKKKDPKIETPLASQAPSPGNIKALGQVRSRVTEKPQSPPKPAFSSIFGKTSGVLKFPGAIEPAWPWKGMVHVRGNATRIDESESDSRDHSKLELRYKKSKGQKVEVLVHEDIISVLAKDLKIDNVVQSIRDINPDEFPPNPPCLRIPIKHHEGGSSLQRRVRKELRARIPLAKPTSESSSEDEIQGSRPDQKRIHPALTKVHDLVATSMSAFDQGKCETQAWTTKYSPKSALEVLQSGRDALVLKDWLQALTVQSVESGSGDKLANRLSLTRSGPKGEVVGKRKRKAKKLNGFIVSTDEEDNAMDEITDPEDEGLSFGGDNLLRKTVMRTGDAVSKAGKDIARLANAVVISGPHGCGKTAAVYAVAKELGFQVFEINSSTRRSGKDIMEKVGDMTRNHLVQQSHSPIVIDDEDARIDEALANDLKSGRQGTMNSFFKPKEPTRPEAKTPKPTRAAKMGDKSAKGDAPTKAPSKKQKQSLILIEEADIIYEEDKNFWATIQTLVATSKRPIIFTCNNELAIPPLSLHAIIRFNPAPVDLAVDYLLLVAACEGHVVKHHAVKTLYESRNFDLRASLMDLNFWCQFAVGDCKSGLGWSYIRWPKGSDIDKNGETIRIVSEHTYENGMGWLSRDMIESHVTCLDIEEELLHEAWDGWQLDAGDWQNTTKMSTWARKIRSHSNKTRDYAALEMYEDFTEAMSTADLCSSSAFASDNQVLVDVNLPALPAKAREDFILAHEVIEASPRVDFNTLAKDISLCMKVRARNYFQVDHHISRGFEVLTELDPPSEAGLIDLIKRKLSSPEPAICRRDFSLAFDPIAESDRANTSSNYLDPSSFDRAFKIIAVDLAPYIRSIVAYDSRLQNDRNRLSNLMSEGGRKGKRMRTTRAAMSALEGGARSTTRRERYFGTKLNPHFVLRTGKNEWMDAAMAEENAARPAQSTGGGSGREESASERDT